ncbi:hypothetical protein [Streptomyces sp. NPDC051109]|uniref:hypothetical protein n=1 Tax=Streptomyces sp. NPDC051109 TaxID=3365642 RepID=UPI0037B57DA7
MAAKEQRVSVRSVERRRRAWRREGGMEALRSTGPANSPTVTDAQFAVLEEELGKGPSAHGFEDEPWTLARVQNVISRRPRVKLRRRGPAGARPNSSTPTCSPPDLGKTCPLADLADVHRLSQAGRIRGRGPRLAVSLRVSGRLDARSRQPRPVTAA